MNWPLFLFSTTVAVVSVVLLVRRLWWLVTAKPPADYPLAHQISWWCTRFGHLLNNDWNRHVWLADNPCLRAGCDGPVHRWWCAGESSPGVYRMECTLPGCLESYEFTPPDMSLF